MIGDHARCALDGGNPNPIRLKESQPRRPRRRRLPRRREPHRGGRRPPGGQRRVLQRRRHPHLDRRPATSPRSSTFDVLPFDNVIVTVPNVTPRSFKELMEWGVGRAAGAPTARSRRSAASRSIVEHDRAPPQVQDAAAQRHDAGPADQVDHARRRHEDRRERRRRRRARRTSTWPRRTSPPTTATATRSRDLPAASPRACPYQQSLFDFIVDRTWAASVTAAQLPGRRRRPHHDQRLYA